MEISPVHFIPQLKFWNKKLNYEEGECTQILHIESFSEERSTIQGIDDFIIDELIKTIFQRKIPRGIATSEE